MIRSLDKEDKNGETPSAVAKLRRLKILVDSAAKADSGEKSSVYAPFVGTTEVTTRESKGSFDQSIDYIGDRDIEYGNMMARYMAIITGEK